MNKVPELWERTEITNKREEEFRRKLLTLEKPKTKTTLITTGAKADRKHVACCSQTLGTEERMQGNHRQTLGVAPLPGPLTGHRTGT